MLRSELWVEEQLVEPQGHLQFAPLKTDASRRRLPLPPFLAEVLRAHLAAQSGGPEALVFTSRDGAALRDTWIRRHFKPAVIKADLPRTFRFHDLRHTCAALLIRQGAGEYEVQRFLGHASPRTTGDNYSHLFEASKRDSLVGCRTCTTGRMGSTRQLPSGAPERVHGQFADSWPGPAPAEVPDGTKKGPVTRAFPLVGRTGIEPVTSCVSSKRSPAELTPPGRHLSRGSRGGERNRTAVEGFAGPCLNHSATPPAGSR